VYSLTASTPVPAAQLARNPGLSANDVNPAVRETVFSATAASTSSRLRRDGLFAATYAIPVWKSASPWFKVEVYNVGTTRSRNRVGQDDQHHRREPRGALAPTASR